MNSPRHWAIHAPRPDITGGQQQTGPGPTRDDNTNSKDYKVRGKVTPASLPGRLPGVSQPPPDHRPQPIMIRVDDTASGGAPDSRSVGPGASVPRFNL